MMTPEEQAPIEVQAPENRQEITESKPREYQLPNDLLLTTAIGSYLGYFSGMGVFHLQELFKDPDQPGGNRTQNILNGVLIGAGVTVAWTAFVWLYSLVREQLRQRPGYEEIDEDKVFEDPALEYKKTLLPSPSKFYPVIVRTFLVSQTVAIIAAMILTKFHKGIANRMPKKFNKMLIDVTLELDGVEIGRSVGTLVGIPISFLFQLVYSLSRRCNRKKVGKIQQKEWYNETRHNDPADPRLFLGAFTGFVLTYGLTAISEWHLDPFNERLFSLSLQCMVAAFVSPYFFNLLVRAFNRCYGKREVEIREGETQYFKLPHPLRPSRIDLGWYGRVFSGVVTAVALGLVQAAYQNADRANFLFIYAVTLFAWITPFIAENSEKILGHYLPNRFPIRKQQVPTPPKLSNLTWSVQTALAVLAGNMFGDSLAYAMDSTSPFLPMLTTWLLFSFTIVEPFLKAGISYLTFIPTKVREYLCAIDNKKADFVWPLGARAFFASVAGALLGPVFFYHQTMQSTSLKGGAFIGPEFLGIDNNHAAPLTSLIFFSGSLFWPLVQAGWDKAQPAISKGLGGCIRYFRHRAQSQSFEMNVAECRVNI